MRRGATGPPRLRSLFRKRAFCPPSLLMTCAAAFWLATSAAGETVTYTLAPRPEDGQLAVDFTWQTEGRTASRMCVSERWGAVADVPGLLQGVEIQGASEVRQDGACWELSHRKGATIRCRYSVSGQRELDWEHLHAPVMGAALFHGIGSTFLITPTAGGAGPEAYEFIVRWQLPKGWDAVCSWARGKTAGALLKPGDFRLSVYLAGELVIRRSETASAADVTVALPRSLSASADDFAEFATGIITEQRAAMEDEEFPPFTVTVMSGKRLPEGQARVAGSGLYRSFALYVPPGVKLVRGPATEEIEHLFAHELFHHWNGQTLQAEEPQRLVYWFTEGLTDYYALRILFEAERWDAATYAKWINRHIRQYRANPARNASNETIAEQYWQQRDTVGEAPYQRGLLLGLRWHKLAREHGVAEGIDKLFKALLERARKEDFKLTNGRIREAGVALLGSWFGPEFDKYVVEAADVGVPKDALAPELRGKVQAVYEFELGFEREESLRQSRVVGLKEGSAAAKAGLKEGDELVGWNIRGDPDVKVQLQVLRGDQLRTISYFPRGAKTMALQFAAAATATTRPSSAR